RLRVRAGHRDRDHLLQHQVFRAACVGHSVLTGLQSDGLAIPTVDLEVEVEVGSEPATRRGINPAETVGEEEAADDRLAVALAASSSPTVSAGFIPRR